MSEDLIQYIKNAKKTTPIKVYLKGELLDTDNDNVRIFGTKGFYVIFGDLSEVQKILDKNKQTIEDYVIENNCRNSATFTGFNDGKCSD